MRSSLVTFARNVQRCSGFHVADGRADHSGEGSAVGVDEQDALGEQRWRGGVEGDDVVVAGDLLD
jgi:hypothetical protein